MQEINKPIIFRTKRTGAESAAGTIFLFLFLQIPFLGAYKEAFQGNRNIENKVIIKLVAQELSCAYANE